MSEPAQLTPTARPLASPPTLRPSARAWLAAGADVWLVRYDPRILQVPIKGGENGGRTLPHKDIVRELVRIGGWNGGAETLPLPPASQPGLVAAILVQTPHGGPILAAAKG